MERRGGLIVGAFLDAFADGARHASFEVRRIEAPAVTASRDEALVVWNGRHLRAGVSAIYCEHGWLPRWSFQVSRRGINADSHLASFQWNGRGLDTAAARQLERRLEQMRAGCPFDAEYMQPDSTAVNDLPDQFLLVPLQMESDTNILRHVAPRLRSMQVFIDLIARSNPPLPLVIKQHPADYSGLHMRLRTSRSQDVLRPHGAGNIHQLLKGGRCRGIISLNSNAVHDGILWNVPSVVLGKNVWPVDDDGPFLRRLPSDWRPFLRLWDDPARRSARDAYAWFLISNQWTLDDARNPARISELLRGRPLRGRKRGRREPRSGIGTVAAGDDGYG